MHVNIKFKNVHKINKTKINLNNFDPKTNDKTLIIDSSKIYYVFELKVIIIHLDILKN